MQKVPKKVLTTNLFKKIKAKYIYIFLMILALILLPVFWNSRIKWTFEKAYGIRLPLKYTIHGIDISHHQEAINWEKVALARSKKSKISFCFIKATEGISIADKDFEKNWSGCKKVGIKSGAYHFYIPWVDAKLQAKNFLSKVTFKKGDLVPVLDFEKEGGVKHWLTLKINVEVFLDAVEAKCGVKPIIYTNKHIYNKYIKGNFDDYPLWIADYKSAELSNYNAAKKLFLWQHSENGRVSGIRGGVDFNVFLGTENEFKEICL